MRLFILFFVSFIWGSIPSISFVASGNRDVRKRFLLVFYIVPIKRVGSVFTHFQDVRGDQRRPSTSLFFFFWNNWSVLCPAIILSRHFFENKASFCSYICSSRLLSSLYSCGPFFSNSNLKIIFSFIFFNVWYSLSDSSTRRNYNIYVERTIWLIFNILVIVAWEP